MARARRDRTNEAFWRRVIRGQPRSGLSVVGGRPTSSSVWQLGGARCLPDEGGICDAPRQTKSREGTILAAGDWQAAEWRNVRSGRCRSHALRESSF